MFKYISIFINIRSLNITASCEQRACEFSDTAVEAKVAAFEGKYSVRSNIKLKSIITEQRYDGRLEVALQTSTLQQDPE